MTPEDLYALDPSEFTAARNALAKELKAAGDKDGAAAVAKLRKPSAGAWALNRVAREEPDLIEAAIDAGLALRSASDDAMAGDASGLKAATADDRAASAAVVKAASPHLGARTEALRQSLVATLRVAALDRDVARQLRLGILTTELEQPGFGFGVEAGEGPVAPKATKATKAAKKPKLRAVPDLPPDDEPEKPDPEELERQKAERAAARAEERQRKKELAAAVRNAERLAREATRLAKEADDVEAEAAAARSPADTAAQRAADARAQVDALRA